MIRTVAYGFLTLLSAGLLAAQTDSAFHEPNNEELVALLSLTDSQVSCLDTNKTAFREAASSSFEKLRSLQQQLREAAASGQDTTALQTQIDTLRASIQSSQATYIASARACLDSVQQAKIAQLVQAETLQNEVREGIGLLLLPSTEERIGGFGRGNAGPRRGRK